MRVLLVLIVGVVGGLILSFLFTGFVMWLYPLMKGAGGDNMTQGIMGTIVLFFSAPVFAIIGGVVAYKLYKRKR